MKKLNPAPTLDRKRPVGEVYGGEPVEGRTARHYQDGHYFTGTGEYIYSDDNARVAPEAAPVERQVPTHTAITDDAEIEKLLKDPAAADLLALDREILVAMVKQAGGPVVAGDDSSRMMAAWLIKHTMASEPTEPQLIDDGANTAEEERQRLEAEAAAAEQTEQERLAREAASTANVGAEPDSSQEAAGAPEAS